MAKKTQRAQKDPAAPKRARTSFVFFTFDARPQILNEFPGIKFVEMGTILAERWRALTPEEKKRYEDMAAQDKIRFQMETQPTQQYGQTQYGQYTHDNMGNPVYHQQM